MVSEKKGILRAVAPLLVSFLAGALFVVGGLTAYRNFFPTQSKDFVKNVPITQAASTVSSTTGSLVKPDIAGIVKDVSPAIVNIEAITQSTAQENPYFSDPFFRDFFGHQGSFNITPQEQKAVGSGFIINKDGYILTNEHVIDGATQINVKLADSNKSYKAKVIGSDAELDLAVIKIDANKDLPYLPMGDSSKVNVGDWAIAIGNPYGLDHTVTVGVISAKGRPVTISSRQYKNLLQTDAAINPGNSGGPLLNTAGEVIGINTAVNAEAQGIGFAIPTATVQDVLKDLLEKGKITRPYLGVYMQDLTEDLAQYFQTGVKQGVLIADVVAGGPADKAGLRKGDVITKVDETTVKDAAALQGIVQKSKVNSKHVLEIYRDGHVQYLSVVLGEK